MNPGSGRTGLPGKCARGAALRAARAYTAPCLPPGEACKHRGGHPGQPPQSRGSPGFPRTPFRPLPPARGRAPRATVDSHTAPIRHRRKPAHCRAGTSVPRRAGERGTVPAKPKGHSQTRECPLWAWFREATRLRQAAMPGPVELSVADARHEHAPPGRRELVNVTAAVVPGVPHQDHPVAAGHFDARAAVAAAVTGLPPVQAIYMFHCSLATFRIRSRDAPRGSASRVSRSKVSAARSRTGSSPVICASTAVSR